MLSSLRCKRDSSKYENSISQKTSCILSGNLAPDGAVRRKITGKKEKPLLRPAVVFDFEQEANDSIRSHQVKAGGRGRLRNVGPKGWSRMQMLSLLRWLLRQGLGFICSLPLLMGDFQEGPMDLLLVTWTFPRLDTCGLIGLLWKMVDQGSTIWLQIRMELSVAGLSDERCLSDRKKRLENKRK